jgi:hypothetical protein
MTDRSSSGKILMFIGAALGILSILLYFFSNQIGAWWQAMYTILASSESSYMNAFGTYSGTEELDLQLGFYGVIGATIFLIGCVLLFITLGKESKVLSILGSIMMIGCLILFLIGLANVTNFNDMITGLDFIRGEDYSVFFGEQTIVGHWTWGLSIGCSPKKTE